MMLSHSSITLVYMGDSITFGQYIDPHLRWTSLVDERLTQRYSHTLIEMKAHNRGVSGETTGLALERFLADVQRATPDVLTLQFGLNDCNCWRTDKGLPRVSEQAFRANLAEMVARAWRSGAREIILATNHRTLRYAPMISGEPYEEANARYSDIIRQVAAETGVTLCDIRRAFDVYSDRELEDLLLPAPDHLHLSVAGNRVYADVIYPYMEEAVESVRRRLPAREGVSA